MKRVFIIIPLFFICISAINAQKINVASYNIRYENNGDKEKGNGWEQRCPVICQLIRFHDFDIFGAQEVLNNQLGDMLEKLPEYSYIGVGRDDGKTAGEYAPIFYKKEMFNMLKTGQFWLSENTDYPNKGWDAVLPRICTWGQFEDKTTGFKFWFFNLHMDHVGVEARRHSASLVLDKIREMCGEDAVILTGDFNVDQTHKSYEILNDSGILRDSYLTAKINYSPNGTFNAFNPNLFTESRIDHIFISQGFTAERYGILTDTYREKKENSETIHSGNFPKEVSLQGYTARTPSDHFPVKVELSFEK
ncbi:endonuclease/exonuclease/phosphatase family protein [Prevotella sp. 10(H)]|uniref:endonuclease/exonuclease/phosphatase family protein n=1 Tax=Prevotella sp. 10(H) TaxID=1158294 RepID=UPI0004A6D306|nr:endonuclease/exonuclease/phosphatase family protein [Prevotella sp. 10(H)]